MFEREGHEVVEVEQRQWDGGAVGLVLRVAGEAAGRHVEAAVARPPRKDQTVGAPLAQLRCFTYTKMRGSSSPRPSGEAKMSRPRTGPTGDTRVL